MKTTRASLQPISKTPAVLTAVLLSGIFSTSLVAETFEKNLEASFPVVSGGKLAKLIIQADRGSIKVVTDSSDKVQIHVFREIKGGTRARADELFANHEVKFLEDPTTVSVVAKTKDNKIWSRIRNNLQVRYEVSIPKKFDVDLNTSGGDIILDDLQGEAVAHTSSGAIKLAKITGRVEARDSGGNISIEAADSVTAHTSSGMIHIRQAAGKVEASDSGGDIRIESAGRDIVAETSSGKITVVAANGSVEARNSGGDIKIENAAGDVKAQTSSGTVRIGTAKGKAITVKNSGGSIEIGEAAGDVSTETSSGAIKIQTAIGKVEAKNSGGDISIGEAGTVAAQTSSGSIKVKTVHGKIEARNSGGGITVGEAGAVAEVKTSSGTITIGQAKGKVEARNSGGDIKLADARDTVMAQTSSGRIQVNFSESPKAPCHLEVSGGGIDLGLPKSAALDLDAKTSGGEVLSDFAPNHSVRESTRHGTLQGKLNGGGPALVLRASSGNIRLRESGTVPVEKEDPSK